MGRPLDCDSRGAPAALQCFQRLARRLEDQARPACRSTRSRRSASSAPYRASQRSTSQTGCECAAARRSAVEPAGSPRRRSPKRRSTALTNPPARAPPDSFASVTLVSTAACGGHPVERGELERAQPEHVPQYRRHRLPALAAPAGRRRASSAVWRAQYARGHLVRQPPVVLGQPLDRPIQRRLERSALAHLGEHLQGGAATTRHSPSARASTPRVLCAVMRTL